MKKKISWRNGHMTKGTITWEYRTINKEVAKELMAKVEQQRPIDQRWVAGLARTMDAGLWDCGAGRGPIALNKEERPINGQHRLAAFLASKLEEITFLFAIGCTAGDISGFDNDVKTRTSKLAHPGMTYASRELGRLAAFDKLSSGNLKIRHTHAIYDQLYGKYRKQCEWAADVMPWPGAQGRAAYVAAFMYAHRADPEFANEKAMAWANGGSGLPQPVLRLRDDALRRTARNGSTGQSLSIRASLKTLTALAFLHQKKDVPSRLTESLYGLKYFSGLLSDGAARRWEDGAHLVPEE